MIKFAGKYLDGRRFVGLGLSRANCERLLKGQPIPVDLSKLILGVNINILIMGGETEAAMQAELQDHIGPETKILPDPEEINNGKD